MRTPPAENKKGPEPHRAPQDFHKADSSEGQSLAPTVTAPDEQPFNSRLGNKPRNLNFHNGWRSFGSSSQELYDAKTELVHCIPEVCG